MVKNPSLKQKFLESLWNRRKREKMLFSDKLPDIPGSNQPPGYTIGGGYSQPLYDIPLYQKYKRVCPNTEQYIKQALWIDIHRFTTDERIKKEMEIFNKVYKEIES